MKIARKFTALLALAVAGSCVADRSNGPAPTSDSFASSPIAPAAFQAAHSDIAGAVGVAAASVSYLSMPAGTIPDGERIVIHSPSSSATVTAWMVDGGLDPVPVPAAAGETLVLEILLASGQTRMITAIVPSMRPPRIVRTNPPPRKRGVALNIGIEVVFSEPMAEMSISPASVHLRRGATEIAGRVELLAGTTAGILFTPTTPLDSSTDYELVVTHAVANLSGAPLGADTTIPFHTGTDDEGTTAYVWVLPDTTQFLTGSQAQLSAVPRDASFMPLSPRATTWRSDDPSVATVSRTGLVTGLAPGIAHIVATIDGVDGVGVIVPADTLPPVATVTVTPATAAIPLGAGGGGLRIAATVRNAAGDPLPLRQIVWVSSDPSIATVSEATSGSALVSALRIGTATISAWSEGHHASATVSVESPGKFVSVNLSPYPDEFACGLTSSAWLMCWGAGSAGQLGNGLFGADPLPAGIGESRFSQVSVAGRRACALTAAGVAYCWGDSQGGALGNGKDTGADVCGYVRQAWCLAIPTPVVGGYTFTSLSTGWVHTCGVTTSGAALCWGDNEWGELGTGDTLGPQWCDTHTVVHVHVSCSTVPTPVTGGLSFKSVVVGGGDGEEHSCALTTDGSAYCWGYNFDGDLGDSTRIDRYTPVAVAGGHHFSAIAIGWWTTCGLELDGTVYCWGGNGGALGIGSLTGPDVCREGTGGCTTFPLPVASSLRFTAITAGGVHVCAIAVDASAYCWGSLFYGPLGDDAETVQAAAPIPVAQGIEFRTLSAGFDFTCGSTLDGAAYCWGNNAAGQLGNGTWVSDYHPVRVQASP